MEDVLEFVVGFFAILLVVFLVLLPAILTFIAGVVFATNGFNWIVILLLVVAVIVQLIRSWWMTNETFLFQTRAFISASNHNNTQLYSFFGLSPFSKFPSINHLNVFNVYMAPKRTIYGKNKVYYNFPYEVSIYKTKSKGLTRSFRCFNHVQNKWFFRRFFFKLDHYCQ